MSGGNGPQNVSALQKYIERIRNLQFTSKSVFWSAVEAVCNKDWSFEVVLKKVSADNEQRWEVGGGLGKMEVQSQPDIFLTFKTSQGQAGP